MNDATQSAGSRAAPIRQFSLRSLFGLTVIIAILLTLGVFTSFWMSLAIVAPLSVWLVDRLHLLTPHRFSRLSALVFLLSLALPAFSLQILGDPEIVQGWQALWLSMLGIANFAEWEWIRNEPADALWALAYVVGTAANALFLAAYVIHFFPTRYFWSRTFSNRAMVAALTFAAYTGVVLFFTTEVHTIYPGFGCWAASMLALYLGTRADSHAIRTARKRAIQQVAMNPHDSPTLAK